MKKKTAGRPPIENGHSVRLPSVRISREQLESYHQAAVRAGKSFAAWLRDVLDKAASK